MVGHGYGLIGWRAVQADGREETQAVERRRSRGSLPLRQRTTQPSSTHAPDGEGAARHLINGQRAVACLAPKVVDGLQHRHRQDGWEG